MNAKKRPVVIAGGGIAGLSTALSLADMGFQARVFEKSAFLEEFGAGLQISPNASRILARLGVLERLLPLASQPDAVRLVDSAASKLRAAMPLGLLATQRWGSAYLVAHRADLHSALLDTARNHPMIEITTGCQVSGITQSDDGSLVSLAMDGKSAVRNCLMVVGADGVWSNLRASVRQDHHSRFTNFVAWRALIDVAQASALPFAKANTVTAYMSRDFHLISYPVKAGKQLNLVAVHRSASLAERWVVDANISELFDVARRANLGVLEQFPTDWTAWPLHGVDPSQAWSDRRNLVLVGDAAHAMTPFGAQGAAMAIEDAYVLARCVAAQPDDLPAAFSQYENQRKPRVTRVIKRGALNQFAWHASGPAAMARNLMLKTRTGKGLMRDLDWLYGFDAVAQR